MLKANSPERPQDKVPDAAGKLADLAENVGEKGGRMLKTGLDKLKLGVDVLSKKVLDAIDKIQPFGMDSKEIGLKISAVLAFLFKPEKKDSEKNTAKENVDIMLQDAKRVDEMRESYTSLKEGDPEKKTWWNKLRDDFRGRIAEKESSGKKNSERLVQFGSIFVFDKNLAPVYDKKVGRFQLANTGPGRTILSMVEAEKIKLPKAISGNAERLFDDGFPQTLKDFKKKLENVGIGVEILSRSALGTFQILPVYHFEKMGWKINLETIYEFLSSPKKQNELMNKIIDDLAAKHNWDYALMAAEYYGGPKAAEAVIASRENPDGKKAERLEADQGVFDTISEYIQGIVGKA